jgi:carboxymethylenebutenolidase
MLSGGGAMKINRTLLFSIIIIFSTGAVFAADLNITTKEVVYYTNGKNVKGYFARPDDNQKHPAMILIHEWWGLNDNIRENARKFAKLGYVALAVDLYEGNSTTTPAEAKKLATHVRQNVDEAFKNLKSAVSYLKSQSYVDSSRLASIGWCFGGGWSYQIAKNNLGVKTSIIYYGRFNPKDDLSKMRATILGHFGENDRAIKVDNVREFQAKLKTLSGDHEIYIYENAGHAFANEGSRYVKEAAELAWSRTVTFLKKHL